ncbi:MAG: alpha/beta fold hydrolase [Planctomycetota bacterium]
MDEDASLHRIEQLANEFFALRNGDASLTIEGFVSRHPDDAEELRDFIEAMELIGFASKENPPKGPPATIGPFKIVRELGRGGMGIVYLGLDPRLDRDVAIKLLNRERSSDPTWVSRFAREAKLASALNHPSILTIYEVGEHNGAPYLATEFVMGETLRERMSRRAVSLSEAIAFGSQLISAIAAAHASKVVHRDLKPDNVMIRSDGLLKVLDFGLAKSTKTIGAGSVASNSVSLPGTVMGTIQFMSPEQARGQTVGTATDVFTFGILLYLLLTGDHPFAGETSSDVMASILQSTPKPFAESGRTLPVELCGLVMECLNKSASDRPDAQGLHARLQTIQFKLKAENAAETETLVSGSNDDTSHGSTRVLSMVASTEIQDSVCEVSYTRSGDVNIAWQSIGEGPIDLVFVMGWVSHLEWFWREPSFAAFLKRLTQFARVILFDKRGTGLSDKVPHNELPTLEQRMHDVRAVMEAAGSKKAVLCGVSEGGPMCSLFSATYPQHTIALVMIGSYARRLKGDGYPFGPTPEQRDTFLTEMEKNWGGPVGIEDRAPSKADDPAFRAWWATYLRMGASPGAAVTLTRMNAQIDVRPILSSIQVPTLILHRSGDKCLVVEEGRYLADRIPGAKFVELPGEDHLPFVGDAESIINEIEEFLTGCRQPTVTDRVLATVVCIALSGKSNHRDQFREQVRRSVELFSGQHLSVTDDQILVTFDGPVRAVRAAKSMCDLAARFQFAFQCGSYTGACDVQGDQLSGPAVEHAGRIASQAPLGAILVSDSVKSLISGADLEFIETSLPGHPEPLHQLVR